jgi:hypothetical protein
MPKVITTHEVDDVAHWLTSPKREEVFGAVAKNICTFVRPDKPNSVGLTMEVWTFRALVPLRMLI